jgi:hypothetical protein
MRSTGIVCASMTAALLGGAGCAGSGGRTHVGDDTHASQDPALPFADAGDLTELPGHDAGPDPDFAECSSVRREATTRETPVDIIFIIDNSASMLDEIQAVRARINGDFAAIIAESGVDYRVIMVSSYRDEPPDSEGLNTSVCIDPPLSGRACDGVDEPYVTNGERFFHYNGHVESLDAWCRLLDSLEQPDEWVFNEWLLDPQPAGSSRDTWQTKFPHGIQEVLREDAFKSFVLFSDESSVCETKRAYDAVGQIADGPPDAHPERFLDSLWDRFDFPPVPDRDEVVAAQFDRALTARAPKLFGTPDNRKYRFHAIVGIAGEGAVQPDQPIVNDTCDSAPSAGRSHQALSRLTGGLRYPICRHSDYDEIFHALARDSIASARLPCRFEIPEPPDGAAFDPGLVNVEYERKGQGTQLFPRAADAAHCNGKDAWFYDDNADPKMIVMCPKTCSELSAAESGSVHIALGCKTVVL